MPKTFGISFNLAWARLLIEEEAKEGRGREYYQDAVQRLFTTRADKWEDEDVVVDLTTDLGAISAYVILWAIDQDPGDSTFLRDMSTYLLAGRPMSLHQMRGLWNVLRAELAGSWPERVIDPELTFPGLLALLTDLGRRLQYPKIAIPLAERGRAAWLSLAGEKSRYPGSINVSGAREYGGEWYGRIVNDVPEMRLLDHPEVMDALINLERIPSIEQAVQSHAIATGACMACGRDLTVASSIQRGLGPVCAKKLGMDEPG